MPSVLKCRIRSNPYLVSAGSLRALFLKALFGITTSIGAFSCFLEWLRFLFYFTSCSGCTTLLEDVTRHQVRNLNFLQWWPNVHSVWRFFTCRRKLCISISVLLIVMFLNSMDNIWVFFCSICISFCCFLGFYPSYLY